MKTLNVNLNKNWSFKKWGTKDKYLSATVPGDVSKDYFDNNGITDYFYSHNYKKYTFIQKEDYEYKCVFNLSDDVLKKERVFIRFKGIDTYAEVSLNGEKLFDADNMFLGYTAEITKLAKKEGNELIVHLKTVYPHMVKNDKYVCIFETNRMFVRKASYQFGWDWAPNDPAYGIYDEVFVWGEDFNAIEDVYVKSKNNGEMNFFISLREEMIDKDILFKLNIGERDFEAKGAGQFSILNASLKEPKLWYPSGYGEQNMYSYKLDMYLDGKLFDTYSGKMAFREIEMDERAISEDSLNFGLIVNGVPVFIKGSNWVPQDCFTGTVGKEKYKKHLLLAKDCNFNMLRIWGGGMYEKDIFYDLCDELGIMVLQETMFACSDIPADYKNMKDIIEREMEYQLKRLRSHPSIVIWSGGNELFDAFQKAPAVYGKKFSDYTLRGMVNAFTDFIFWRSSPHGFTRIANEPYSGDGHEGFSDIINKSELSEIREKMMKQVRSPLTTETAIGGSCRYSSLTKFVKEEDRWPIGDYLNERFYKNPYGGESQSSFALNQKMFAEKFFGDVNSAPEYCKKTMLAQLEMLRFEADYNRFKGSRGLLNWMFGDTWPTGTWAVVDYYLKTKGGYYGMKRAFEPLTAVIADVGDKTVIKLSNHLPVNKEVRVTYGARRLNGEVIEEHKRLIENIAPTTDMVLKIMPKYDDPDIYIFARVTYDDKQVYVTYFPKFWKDLEFKSDYSYEFKEINKGEYELSFKSNEYTRCVFIDCRVDEAFVLYSDNMFDMEKGEERKITIKSDMPLTKNDIVVKDYNDVWN